MEAKKAFPTELGLDMLVWSEQMNRFHALCNKGNRALFKVSRSVAETKRVMQFFNEILADYMENQQNGDAASFGRIPAHFLGANRPSIRKVVDPKKIISKGAPSLKKRWKAYPEMWKTD
ncbi:hypothetical protein ACP70R_037541 [Stipagrostis hirtigluma subsp. patula]